MQPPHYPTTGFSARRRLIDWMVSDLAAGVANANG
jgi:hypothetical protein